MMLIKLEHQNMKIYIELSCDVTLAYCSSRQVILMSKYNPAAAFLQGSAAVWILSTNLPPAAAELCFTR